MTANQADLASGTRSTRPEAPAEAASEAPAGNPAQPRPTLPEGMGELIDSRGMPAGRVDDLELTALGPGEPPVLTALLCGATAFGPRLGGRLGTWWQAIGRRLRPDAKSLSPQFPGRPES